MMQFVSQSWKDLGDEERRYFQDKADLDKERYERQMEEYQVWGRQNPNLLKALESKGPCGGNKRTRQK